jgi:hypothetical protein
VYERPDKPRARAECVSGLHALGAAWFGVNSPCGALGQDRERRAQDVLAEAAPQLALASRGVEARLVLDLERDAAEDEPARIAGRLERRRLDLLFRTEGARDDTGRPRIEGLVVRRGDPRCLDLADDAAAREPGGHDLGLIEERRRGVADRGLLAGPGSRARLEGQCGSRSRCCAAR